MAWEDGMGRHLSMGLGLGIGGMHHTHGKLLADLIIGWMVARVHG